MPPHGGIALGLDRIVMFLTQTENIKRCNCIPQDSERIMSSYRCPNIVDESQLNELHIKKDLDEE
ncbi:MAG: hypothetical protein Ct9H90mP6_09780 [Gammaproteobacteria bacterium]|nr:MAG: hypothetical protein Ct9H90mP6_09780 [Gammaproteobacteria bacterium]